MACPERERLQERYADATRIYSEAVQELRDRMGKLPEEAYIRLERHVAEHGCRNS